MCVAYKAKYCVTLEYNTLSYEHPGIHTITVADWEAARAAGV